jgi:hypothetical protein
MMPFRLLIFCRTYCLSGLLVSLLAGLGPVMSGCAERQEEPVVALVNGRAITQTEFDLRWGELSKATRSRYEKEGQATIPERTHHSRAVDAGSPPPGA